MYCHKNLKMKVATHLPKDALSDFCANTLSYIKYYSDSKNTSVISELKWVNVFKYSLNNQIKEML